MHRNGIGLQTLLIAIFALVLWVLAFWPAINSALYMWYSDTTFNHCFFVIPAVLYFGYKEWPHLDFSSIKLDFLAIFTVIGLIGVWGFGYAANIQLFVHLTTFSILPVLVWLCIGRNNALRLWFPLTFMLFSVPFGSELIAPFQSITAEIAVYLLNLVGIPTFQSGLYIDVPNGKFEVAEACAGVRFFIASLCFGYFYAYISYKKLYKRIVFIIFSALFPIIANGFRVFGTIVIGEKIGMQYAAGADHLVYGWVFFAIVLLLLIWIGSYWQDNSNSADSVDQEMTNRSQNQLAASWILLLPLLVITMWRVVIDQASPASATLLVNNTLNLNNSVIKSNWQPQFFGASETFASKDINSRIEIFIATYNIDSDSAELISFNNRFYRQDAWTVDKEQMVGLNSANLDDLGVAAGLLDLRSPTGLHRMVVYWYELPGYRGASVLQVKVRQALGKLTGQQYPAAVIMLSREYQPNMLNDKKDILEEMGQILPRLQEITKEFN